MGLFRGKKEKLKMFFNSVNGLNVNANERIEIVKGIDSLIINKALTTINLETIKYSDVISINRYNEQEIIQKSKSVVGRAIVGGVLTGGIGAVVGGLSGVGTKTKKGKMKYFVNIEYFKNGMKLNIVVEDYMLLGTDKFISDIQNRILEYKNKAQNEITELPQDTTNNIPDLIKKLSDLNKAGIISDSEFEEKKTKLLNQI